jgi:hypothetical protein
MMHREKDAAVMPLIAFAMRTGGRMLDNFSRGIHCRV